MQYPISIIIRSYNEERHVGRLLEGLSQQTIKDVEIILVDSGSIDGTLGIATQYPVRFITIPSSEFSFGRSLNKGCQAASGEFIVVVSAHCYPVYTNWLEKLLEPFENSDSAVVYGKQRGNQLTTFSEHQVFAKWFPEESNFDQTLPFCNNANAAIRRSIWEKLPYDESLTGLEDIDFAKRALQLGYNIVYKADAEVIHVHDESPVRLFNRFRREAIALKRIFPDEHFGFWDFLRLLTINIGHDCYLSAREHKLAGNLKEIFCYRLMQFWGTYRGFTQRRPLNPELKQRFYYPNGKINSQKRAAKLNPDRKINYGSLNIEADRG